MNFIRKFRKSFKKKNESSNRENNSFNSGHYYALVDNKKIDGQNINPEMIQKSVSLPVETAHNDNSMDNDDNGNGECLKNIIIKKLSLYKNSNLITGCKIDETCSIPNICYFANIYEQFNRNNVELDFDNDLKTNHPLVLTSERNKTLFLSKYCQTCNENDSIFLLEEFKDKLFIDLLKYYELNDGKIKKLSFYLNGDVYLSNFSLELFAKFCKTFGPTINELRFLTKYTDIQRIDWFSNTLSSISIR